MKTEPEFPCSACTVFGKDGTVSHSADENGNFAHSVGFCDETVGVLCDAHAEQRAAYIRDMTIRTNYDHPPIPTRSHDWSAWQDGTEEHGPIGHGATEAEAIADLREMVNEL